MIPVTFDIFPIQPDSDTAYFLFTRCFLWDNFVDIEM